MENIGQADVIESDDEILKELQEKTELEEICKKKRLPQPVYATVSDKRNKFRAYVVVNNEFWGCTFWMPRKITAIKIAMDNAVRYLKLGKPGTKDEEFVRSLKMKHCTDSSIAADDASASSSPPENGDKSIRTNSISREPSAPPTPGDWKEESKEADFEMMIQGILEVLRPYPAGVQAPFLKEKYEARFQHPLPEKWLQYVRDGAEEIDITTCGNRVVLALKKKRGQSIPSGESPVVCRRQNSTVSFRYDVAEVREFDEKLHDTLGDTTDDDKRWGNDQVPEMNEGKLAKVKRPVTKQNEQQSVEVDEITNGLCQEKENLRHLEQRKEVSEVLCPVELEGKTDFSAAAQLETLNTRSEEVKQKEEVIVGLEDDLRVQRVLTPIDLPPSEKFDATVVFAPDPWDFSIHLESLRPVDVMIGDLLQAELKDVKEIPEIKSDSFYAGFDEEAETWYRVYVGSGRPGMILEGFVRVFLVDFGQFLHMNIKNLRTLPLSSFCMPNILAIKCRMVGICPKGKSWSEEAMTSFSEKVRGKTVKVNRIGEVKEWRIDGSPTLPMICVKVEDKDGKDVSEWMVEMDLASRV